MQIGKVVCPSVKQKIGDFAAALHLLLHFHCSSKCYPAKRDVIEYYTITIETFQHPDYDVSRYIVMYISGVTSE